MSTRIEDDEQLLTDLIGSLHTVYPKRQVSRREFAFQVALSWGKTVAKYAYETGFDDGKFEARHDPR